MTLTTYETPGHVGVPTQIIQNKKAVLRGLFEDRAGEWITNNEVVSYLADHGLAMNQVTARISDLRAEYHEEGLGIFSDAVEPEHGKWRYKLDLITPEYTSKYLKNREEFTQEDKKNFKAAFMFVLERYPTQDESFWTTATKLGIKSNG